MASVQRPECPICMESFTSSDRIPKGLPCHHSICLPCAKQLIQNNQIQCPTCRNVESLTDANKLFTHHVVLATVQDYEREDKQQDQNAIKDDLEEAFDRISQYKLKFNKKIALVEENNTKLRKSAAQAKRETKAKFEACIKMLQDRMSQVLEEIETVEKSYRVHVKEVQANFDKAARLQHEHENLVEKEVMAEEYDNFKKSEAVLKSLLKKEDQQCQEIKVTFDQSPYIEDVIKKFGQLQAPKVGQVQAPKSTAGVPPDVTQLVHIRTIGCHGSGRGQLKNPQGVAVRPTGTILVVDRDNHRVQEMDMDGGVVRVIGAKGGQDGCFFYPSDVAVDASDQIYVADQSNHRIQIFNYEGKYLKKFGQKGSGQGEFCNPKGLAIDHAHKLLYIADEGNHRVQVFDLEGNHKRVIGNDTGLKLPCYLCLHGDRLYVSDRESHHIAVYSTNGNKLHVIGKPGKRPGEFDYPAGIAADSHGRIFVSDLRNNRVQIMDGKTGQTLHVFGCKGSKQSEFNQPEGVAFTPSGQLVVTDYFGHGLQIFDTLCK